MKKSDNLAFSQEEAKMFTPYIGITDFRTEEQARAMLAVFEEHLGNLKRRLMVGVMMSHRTLNGLPSKWTEAFPHNEEINSIFVNHPLAFNAIHYADYRGESTIDDLRRAIWFGGPYLHALQFDMTWPAPEMVRQLKQENPNLRFILQVGKVAFKDVHWVGAALTSRVLEYGRAIDVVLLDQSGGEGVRLNAKVLLPYIVALRYHLALRVHVAVAGGLGPETVYLIEPLLPAFPFVSTDAQGKLRRSGSALDPIDWDLASEYLKKELELFNQYR